MVKFLFAFLAKNEEIYSRKQNKNPTIMKAAINEIRMKMAEIIRAAVADNEHSAYTDYEAGDFYFTVETNEDDEVNVTVLNVETDEDDYPRVTEAIKEAVPCWRDIADEYWESQSR